MDVLKLRYLIREAIEDTVKQQSSFNIGDKVTTVDGNTATITMAEHPFYTVELESTGTTKSYAFKDIAPFVEKEIEPQQEGFLLKENVNVSPGLEFHYKNKLNLLECVYRIGSEAYINFYAEAKQLLKEGKITVNTLDKEVLKTDIGEYGLLYEIEVGDKVKASKEYGGLSGEVVDVKGSFIVVKTKEGTQSYHESDLQVLNKEGIKVPLDLPMLNESTFNSPTHIAIFDGPEGEVDVYKTPDGFYFDTGDYDGEASSVEEAAEWLKRNGFIRLQAGSLNEAKKKKKSQKKDPPIGKPKRGGSKAYYVYVRDPKTKRIKKVSFGSGGLRAKINNPKARQAFAARHRCSEKNDRTKPSYWSCRLPRYAKALGLGANKNTYW